MARQLTFVSAGAGSGKTRRLTEILHERLAGGTIDPAGVIATTFTRKAATELRERARGHLLARGCLDLANEMGQAIVGTVNGICQNLLQRFCFEAGLSPDLRVLDEADAAVLLRECIDEQLDQTTIARLGKLSNRLGIENWSDDLSRLIAQARANDIAPDQLVGMAQRNADELLQLFGTVTSRDLDVEIKALIDNALPTLRNASAGSKVKKTADYVQLIEEFRRKLEYGNYQWSDWTKLAIGSPEVGLASLVATVKETAAEYLSHRNLQADVRDYIALGFAVAGQVLNRYAERKRDLGALDFTDQEVLLLKAIEVPAIAAALGEELDLLLVDEFQDTSPVQLALFMKLTRFAKETYWVGDVKQAIYGFRGSDSQLMDSVIQALPSLGGTTEILGESWRSRPSLVKLVNEVFVPAFKPLPAEQIELVAQRQERSPESAFETWELVGKSIALRIDALAQQVRALLASDRQIVDKSTDTLRPLRPGDVAVLCRSHERIATVLGSFTAAGVPFATGHAGLLGRPECVLALACLRRLNDASDTIATAEILSLGDCQEPEIWLADRLAHLAAGGELNEWQESPDPTHPVLARIAEFRAELPMLSPREAMERVVSGCELVPRVLRWCRSEVEARQRVANLDVLMTLAGTYEDGCRTTGRPGSISGLILWLDALAKQKEDQQPTLSADAVQVLTHHAAKGLEWPVVILLDLEADHRDRFWGIAAESDGALDIHAPLKNRFIRFRPWPFGKTTKVPLRDIAAASPAGRAASVAAIEEGRRLLYVSMTRARDLMIFGLQKLVWDDEQWLGVTKAAWLLSSATANGPALPANLQIPSLVRQAKPADDVVVSRAAPIALHWFDPVPATGARLPLFVLPSSATAVRCTPSEPMHIGGAVPIASGFDRAVVGTALHAVIAAGLGESGPLSVDETSQLLCRHRVGGSVDPERLRSFVASLRDWISATWPNGTAHAEVPVRAWTQAGQIARGQIDLLIELPGARVIVDHKTGARVGDGGAAVLEGHAGQLAAYNGIVNVLAPVPRAQLFVVMPGAGMAHEITP